NCIESFERFTKQFKCPLCRHEDYEKRAVFFPEDAYLDNMATILQAAWRAKKARRKVSELRAQTAKNIQLTDVKVSEVRYAKNLQYLTRKAGTSFELVQKEHEQTMNDFMNDLDSALEENRNLMSQLNERLTGKSQEHVKFDSCAWYEVWQSHLSRETKECPICLLEWSPAKSRVLLSCSHVFHSACLLELEKHFDNISSRSLALVNCEGKSCPICRWANYEKKIVPGVDRFQCLY
ncbi:RING finger protein 32, partial [Cichlidogyrus casuarinus]